MAKYTEKIAMFVLIYHVQNARDEDSLDELATGIAEFHATNVSALSHFDAACKVNGESAKTSQ